VLCIFREPGKIHAQRSQGLTSTVVQLTRDVTTFLVLNLQ
jgi:hypothetical protein